MPRGRQHKCPPIRRTSSISKICPPIVSSMELGQGQHLGLRKYEIVKIVMLYNPNGAMRSIMYVFDDFTGFGSFLIVFTRNFKIGLENRSFLPSPNYIFSES